MKKKFDTNRAKRLKLSREHLEKSPQDMADIFGLKVRTIYSWEQAAREPQIYYLDYLGKKRINVHWIITGEGEMELRDTAMPHKNLQKYLADFDRIVSTILSLSDPTKRVLPSENIKYKVLQILVNESRILAEDESKKIRRSINEQFHE